MSLNRREFLGTMAAASAAYGQQGTADKIRVGVMGTGGRGTALARAFESSATAEVKYVCDTDKKRADQAAATVVRTKNREGVQAVTDYRRMLDDKAVDVIAVATPNHWHAPAAILACAAGKHVYVEKPCSHNPHEGELMVQAARKHKRHVQMGNQRRSYPKIMEGIEQVRKGIIGRVYYSRGWYANKRDTIGKGKETPVPEWLDYDLWQGPAPRRPYRDNILHYNWHWFWHWGNGELGNNGIHAIDVCRWGLGVDYPIRVNSTGGRYAFDDDQETPDTHVVTFEFEGKKSIMWEGLSCNYHGVEGGGFGVSFHGEKGTVLMTGNGFTVYDKDNHESLKVPGTGGDMEHIQNFLDAIQGKAKLNSEIEEAHKSVLLCHLGNIAHRTGRAVKCDPKNGHILDDDKAAALWKREYQPGWEPKV